MKRTKPSRVFVTIFLTVQLLGCGWLSALSALAEPATGSGSGSTGGSGVNPVNLDLNSTERNLNVGNLANNKPLTIQVGDTSRTLGPQDVVTAGERLAAYQIFSTGQQSILLGNLGNAVGGSFTMGPKFNQYVSDLVIPAGVTAVRDFGTAASLNLAGNLVNQGSLFALSSNSQVTTAAISAANIFNQQGAILSSVLPAQELSGMTSAVSALNLQLTALQNIVNAGKISSSGALSAVAGGSIINSGSNAVMQAVNNINLVSGAANIINSGVISSLAGNVNLASLVAQNLTVNNIGGRLEALAGAVNLRDSLFKESFSTLFNGGEILSKELNLHAGNGKVDLTAEHISGLVNSWG